MKAEGTSTIGHCSNGAVRGSIVRALGIPSRSRGEVRVPQLSARERQPQQSEQHGGADRDGQQRLDCKLGHG